MMWLIHTKQGGLTLASMALFGIAGWVCAVIYVGERIADAERTPRTPACHCVQAVCQ